MNKKRDFLIGLLVVAVVLFAVDVLKKEPAVAFTPSITNAEGNEILTDFAE